MKHLKVVYNNDIVLFDGEVDEVSWSDGPNGINVAGKIRRQGGGGGGNILEMLAAARKAKTAEAVSVAREELNSEPVSQSPQP